jgi:hypothetical protein
MAAIGRNMHVVCVNAWCVYTRTAGSIYNKHHVIENVSGARGSVVIEAVGYKPEGRGF